MTNNLNSQKGKDYQNKFSQCSTLPFLLWQKNIYRVSAVCRCAVLQRLQMSAIGERDITQLFSAIIYIHHVCTLHACIRLFCKDFAWFHRFSKKTKKMPLELGSDFTCKFIGVDVCFVDCFISLCWFFVKFSGNSIQLPFVMGSFWLIRQFWPQI